MASALERWARAYRESAKADNYRAIRERLEEAGFVDADELGPKAVEDAICLVELSALGRNKAGFLALQVYDSADSHARYVLSFQGGRHDLARVYFDDISKLDMVEIHDDNVGFRVATVALVSVKTMEVDELKRIEESIRNDFAHDYGEDEIELTFDDSSGHLQVEVVRTD